MKGYLNKIIKVLDEACEKESLEEYLIILQDASKEVEGRINTLDDPKFYERYYGI